MSSLATERPTLPAPAMATRMSVPSLGRGAGHLVHAGGHVVGDQHEDLVTVLDQGRRGRQGTDAEAHHVRHPGAGRLLQHAYRPADPAGVHGYLGDRHHAGRVAPHLVVPVRDDVAEDPVGRPPDGSHRRDTEPLVDLGALRVVDPCDDPGHAEGLPGQPGGDDVGVVAAGHGGEGVRALDAGGDQDVPVEADPGDGLPGEVGAEAAERVGVLVDHRDRVATRLEHVRQGRTDPSAAHDHDVHLCASRLPNRSTPHSVPCTTRERRASLAKVTGHPAAAPGGPAVRLTVVASPTSLLKRLLIGRPFKSDRMHHTLLPKRIALPVFASDALSSVAYAPDEILLTLSVGGAAFFAYSPWIALAVVVVMLVVVASYRQNVHAYPSGGGDYEVATVNLGPKFGLVVASALMVDYVLTVAVSVSSGVENLGAAWGFAADHKVEVAVVLVVVLTAMNLRGIREAGIAFAIPTYAFMGSILLMIGWGMLRVFVFGDQIRAESSGLTIKPAHEFMGFAFAFLMVRTFSSGCTALTGVEAISNGVPAFKPPKSRNAATTLLALGALAITMFSGITALALISKVRVATDTCDLVGFTGNCHADPQRTVIAQIAAAVFGGTSSIGFFYIQAATALI